jgi:integrase
VRLKEFLASKHYRQNGQGILFANRRGRPFSANKLREKKLRPLLVSLGIPLAGFHAFRHGVATKLIDQCATSRPSALNYDTAIQELLSGCIRTSFLNRKEMLLRGLRAHSVQANC